METADKQKSVKSATDAALKQAATRNTLTDDSSKNTEQYVVFNLGDEEYGLSIYSVQSIEPYTKSTVLPDCDPCVEGVINLRGDIIPIINLRKKFDLDDTANKEFYVTIIINVYHKTKKKTMGIVVDSVNDVLNVESENVQDMSALSMSVNNEYLEKTVQVDGRIIVVLDLNKLFSEKEIQKL